MAFCVLMQVFTIHMEALSLIALELYNNDV